MTIKVTFSLRHINNNLLIQNVQSIFIDYQLLETDVTKTWLQKEILRTAEAYAHINFNQ